MERIDYVLSGMRRQISELEAAIDMLECDRKKFMPTPRGEEMASPYKVDSRWHCGKCSTAVGRFWHYCQQCGVKIDWDNKLIDWKTEMYEDAG